MMTNEGEPAGELSERHVEIDQRTTFQAFLPRLSTEEKWQTESCTKDILGEA